MFFRFGRNPDELPREGYGFEEWLEALANGDEDGEIESGTYEGYTRSGVIASESGEYHIEFFETYGEHDYRPGWFFLIYGKMVRTADQTVVAVINAQLLKRASQVGTRVARVSISRGSTLAAAEEICAADLVAAEQLD